MTTESPCINIYQIDEKTHYCLGCFRSIKEISEWSTYNEIQKKKILKLISERKDEIFILNFYFYLFCLAS